MTVSFVCFLILVITAPLDLFWSWPGVLGPGVLGPDVLGPDLPALVLGLRLLAAGTGLFFAVQNLSEREKTFLRKATSYASFGLFAMASWILIQIMPLGLYAHPFWSSAAEALRQPLTGRMSIDAGAGLMAFCRLLLAIVIGFLAAILAIDRRRAERILTVMTIAAVLILESLLFGSLVPAGLGAAPSQPLSDDLVIFASLALVLTLTTATCAFERFETRRSQQNHPMRLLVLREAGCLFGFGVAAAIVWLTAHPALILAAISGVALPAAVILVRRLNFDPLLQGLFLTVLLCTLCSVIGVVYFRAIDAHSSFASDELRDAAAGMLRDAPPAGTGAGTFSSLLPLYRGHGSGEVFAGVPGALILQIELGRTAFWLLILFAAIVIFRLLRSALLRGRDSFYAAAGAGCLSVLWIDLFLSAGVFSPPDWIFASAVSGLALAQTQSRGI